jgi:copper chaperone CopZ
MPTSSYLVTGMTCGHCTNAVSTALSKLPGVTDVSVDLATGTVDVTSTTTLDTAAISDAIEEAGYELADRLDRHVVLAHLADVRPDGSEPDET